MSEPTGSGTDALFRANKRRKIYRKRNVDGEDDHDSSQAEVSNVLDTEVQETLQNVRRPAARKHGIGFSTTGSKVVQEAETPTPTALVPFQPGPEDDPATHDRFIKPAGKTAVVEDKHLTAYVDSKLAELRSSTSTPNPYQNEARAGHSSEEMHPSDDAGAEAEEPSTHSAATNQQIRQQQRVKPTKRRRGPPQRDAHDIARDAMVDEIMRESQVPIYDQSTSKTQEPPQPTGVDADEAAAEAFRAEFLLSLQERQNRRRPAAPPVQQRGAPPVPTGPKLGGSRAQREKMRAIEEAKAAGKSVDAMPPKRR